MRRITQVAFRENIFGQTDVILHVRVFNQCLASGFQILHAGSGDSWMPLDGVDLERLGNAVSVTLSIVVLDLHRYKCILMDMHFVETKFHR